MNPDGQKRGRALDNGKDDHRKDEARRRARERSRRKAAREGVLRRGVRFVPEAENVRVSLCDTWGQARSFLTGGKFPLPVLAVNLPDGSGVDFPREARRGGCLLADTAEEGGAAFSLFPSR